MLIIYHRTTALLVPLTAALPAKARELLASFRLLSAIPFPFVATMFKVEVLHP